MEIILYDANSSEIFRILNIFEVLLHLRSKVNKHADKWLRSF